MASEREIEDGVECLARQGIVADAMRGDCRRLDMMFNEHELRRFVCCVLDAAERVRALDEGEKGDG